MTTSFAVFAALVAAVLIVPTVLSNDYTSASVEGRVIEADGSSVTLVPYPCVVGTEATWFGSQADYATVVSPDGTFGRSVGPGRYRVSVDCPGREPSSEKTVTVWKNGRASVEIRLGTKIPGWVPETPDPWGVPPGRGG